MKITGLGHSSFVFEMAGAGGVPVRVLVDPWLSDHVVGDAMGRFPRLRIDFETFGPVDGLWLSHSHTDHLDPESLLALRAALDPFPALLLPTSLLHLAPLLAEHLGDPETVVVAEDEIADFRGLTLTGFYNPEREASNEDDVMVLAATNGREALVAESDAVLPYDDPDLRERLAELLLAPAVETAALLTTKNQLAATMAVLAARNRKDRLARLSDAIEATYDEIWALYGTEEDALFGDPRLTRLVGGQGIAMPAELGTDWNRVLFPIGIEDRVRMEREVALQCDCAHTVLALAAGEVHHLGAGDAASQPAPGVRLLDSEEDRRFDPDLDVFGPFPAGPIRDEARDADEQAARILAALNHRYLPFLTGQRNPAVEQLLTGGGGEWRVRVRFGTTEDFTDRDFRLSFERPQFEAVPPAGDPGEHYWANDLDDVLTGRADEFTTICREPLPAPAQHLWLALGMPWLCRDLVETKLRFHFERCAAGEKNADFTLPLWR